MPPITKDDPNVISYLEQNGFVLRKKYSMDGENLWLEEKLRNMHHIFRRVDPARLVHSILIAHLIAFVTYSRFRN